MVIDLRWKLRFFLKKENLLKQLGRNESDLSIGNFTLNLKYFRNFDVWFNNFQYVLRVLFIGGLSANKHITVYH